MLFPLLGNSSLTLAFLIGAESQVAESRGQRDHGRRGGHRHEEGGGGKRHSGGGPRPIEIQKRPKNTKLIFIFASFQLSIRSSPLDVPLLYRVLDNSFSQGGDVLLKLLWLEEKCLAVCTLCYKNQPNFISKQIFSQINYTMFDFRNFFISFRTPKLTLKSCFVSDF